MELWLKTSKLTNYADDTTTDNKSKCIVEIKTRLKEDTKNVLDFMASNGLKANQAKTEFILLNARENVYLQEIKVGETSVNSGRLDQTVITHLLTLTQITRV